MGKLDLNEIFFDKFVSFRIITIRDKNVGVFGANTLLKFLCATPYQTFLFLTKYLHA